MEIPVWKRAGKRIMSGGAVALESLRGAYPESVHSDSDFFDPDYEIDVWSFDNFPEDAYVSYGDDKGDLDPDAVPMMGMYNFGNTEGLRRSIAVSCNSYALGCLSAHGLTTPRSWKHQRARWKWMEKRRMRRFQKEHLKDSIPASFLKGVESRLSAYERYPHEGALP